MSELFEMLLQVILELLLHCVDFSGAWRFSLAAIAGVGAAALVAWRVPGRPVPVCLGLVVAGAASGVWWELRSRRE